MTIDAKKLNDCISEKIKLLMGEGKPRKQAIAIAISMCNKKLQDGDFTMDAACERGDKGRFTGYCGGGRGKGGGGGSGGKAAGGKTTAAKLKKSSAKPKSGNSKLRPPSRNPTSTKKKPPSKKTVGATKGVKPEEKKAKPKEAVKPDEGGVKSTAKKTKIDKDLGIEFDMDGVPNDIAKSYRGAIEEAKAAHPGFVGGEYGFKSLKAVPASHMKEEGGGDTWVMGSKNGHDFFVNKDMVSKKGFVEKLKKDEDSGFHPKTNDPVKATAVHEMGHAYKTHLVMTGGKGLGTHFENAMNSLFDGDDAKISKYARDNNWEEKFAEGFVAARMGGNKYKDVEAVKSINALINVNSGR